MRLRLEDRVAVGRADKDDGEHLADTDSSTASEGMLVVRPSSTSSSARRDCCYSRRTLLTLSRSDKVACPPGLKPLNEWYGEYEAPAGPAVNSGPTGGQSRPGVDGTRHGPVRGENRDGANVRERAGWDRDKAAWDRDRGARSREEKEHRGTAGGSGTAIMPVTGQMGDFRLAGSRPYNSSTNGVKEERKSATAAASRGEAEGKDQAEYDRDRLWSGSGVTNTNAAAGGADRRRAGGDFVKKGGRAAEEGGWRSVKEARDKDRPLRGNERERGGPQDRERDRSDKDRRRQPAWMDEEPQAGLSSAKANIYPSSAGAGSRRSNGYHEEALPAWAADDNSPGGLGIENSRGGIQLEESPEERSNGKSRDTAQEIKHVDSIQAWKAEMKELEAKKKREEEKTLRKEMGLPDVPADDEGRAEMKVGT